MKRWIYWALISFPAWAAWSDFGCVEVMAKAKAEKVEARK